MIKIDEKNFKKIRKWAFLMNSVPFLRGSFVCNSYAMGTATDESDIDLFVVAKRGRLYTARFFMNFLFKSFGVRTHGDKTAGKFCLSFFADERNLNFLPLACRKDFYLAYWVYTLRPVVDRGVSSVIESRNGWVSDLIGSELRLDRSFVWRGKGLSNIFRKFFEIILFGPIGGLMERFLRSIQIKGIRKRLKRSNALNPDVMIKNGLLKLHENDRRILFRDEYIRRYGIKFYEENFILLLQHFRGK